MNKNFYSSNFNNSLIANISYNPETGYFSWILPGPGRILDKQAGSVSNYGYRVLNLDKTKVMAHRAAFFLMTGEWAEKHVDHINCDRLDNRWINLRLASHNENLANTGLSKRNNSGVKGVYWNKEKSKWHARFTHNEKTHFVGYFDLLDDARIAWENKGRELVGDFVRSS